MMFDQRSYRYLIICSSLLLTTCRVPSRPSEETTHSWRESIKPLTVGRLLQVSQSQASEAPLHHLWMACLTSMIPQGISSRQDDPLPPIDPFECSSLLTRPSEDDPPPLLNGEWIVLDTHEQLRLSLALHPHAGMTRLGQFAPGEWTLDITLLRLPKAQTTSDQTSRAKEVAYTTPPPLRGWHAAKIKRMLLSSWGPTGVTHQTVMVSEHTKMDNIPLPRVGQALTLRLTRPAPSIQRGGWAMHLPLWLNAPILRRVLTLSLPHGAQLTHFGPHPIEELKLSAERRYRWESMLQHSGEGGTIYLTSTPSWRELNQWLWSQLHQQHDAYQSQIAQSLSHPQFQRFLSPMTQNEIHRWINHHFHYAPDLQRPYQPLSPKELMRRRSGDCKDLSTLAMSLLTMQGERPRYALTSTHPIPPFAPSVPSIGWFDHVLLWLPTEKALSLAELMSASGEVELDSPLIRHQWFDPTSTRSDVPQSIAHVAYVLLSPEHGIWVPLTSSP